MSTNIHVIGLGSPFSNDQIGCEVLHDLALLKSLQPHINETVKMTAVDRPGLELVNMIEGYDHVFLIDAIKTNGFQGKIMTLNEDQILQSDSQWSSHGFGVIEALKLCKALEVMPNDLRIMGISVNQVTYGEGMDPELIPARITLVHQLEDEILHLINTESSG